ncbi:MAG: hypothetical protein Q9167_000247 [Letrouitia subvulpina]
MAPRASRIFQHNRPSVSNTDNEIPPSTLAAQIVDSLTDGSNNIKQDDHATFQQLLCEILDAEHCDRSGTVNQSDIKLNCRLLYVIVKAGVEPIDIAQTVQEGNEHSEQILRCLSVIELTIRKCPDVLFASSSDGNPDVGPPGPMYIWLIPKLLFLLHVDQSSSIHAKVLSTIQSAIFSQVGDHVVGAFSYPILKYVQGCAFDFLFEVQYGQDAIANKWQTYFMPSPNTILVTFSSPTNEVDDFIAFQLPTRAPRKRARFTCPAFPPETNDLSPEIRATLSTVLGLEHDSTASILGLNVNQQFINLDENQQNALTEDLETDELFSVLSNLIKLPQTQRSRKPRVASMMASQRLLVHCSNNRYLDLTTSVSGQFCLQALRSSLRDLRVAAGRTLPIFLRDGIDEEILKHNRVFALDFLRNLSEKSELALQETCILAWGQIARVLNGDETNIVLIQLVKYLGHTNQLICGLAYDELLKETQAFTIPYLVLTKRRDILQKVADACGQTIRTICMEHSNMASILTNILLCPSEDVEGMVVTLLRSASSEFNQIDCAELVRTEPVLIASELLKVAGDADRYKGSKAREALHFLANLTHDRHGTSKRIDILGTFFEIHVLGIMAHLSDSINDGKGSQSTLEKMRCLAAISEMIKIANNHVSNGLPQISACLRSAIGNTELCNQAFTSWITMMSTLGTDEISALVDPTIAIIAHYWNRLTPKIQARAYDMVTYLFDTHPNLVLEHVNTIPSLASIPLMSKFEQELFKRKNGLDLKRQLQALIERSQNENITVVSRALVELEIFLQQHQEFVYESATSEPPDPMISRLARSLLDACVRFNESDDDVSLLCANCIGLVGCLDSTRIEAIREKKDMLMLSNFQEAGETVDFVIFFLQEVLVKAFLSATNPRSQGFLAYTMQELLKFCGLNGSVTLRTREVHSSPNYIRWMTLSESVRNTLTPFLTSKYVVTAAAIQPDCSYPIYRPGLSHGQWIRTFVYDLLRKGRGENIEDLFPVLSRIIRTQDTPISIFLLPFAILNIVISGTVDQQDQVRGELLVVLNHPLSEEDAGARDSLLLCSQEKKKQLNGSKSLNTRQSPQSQNSLEHARSQVSVVESVLRDIPADVIARRAVECKSFARALFYWEQYIREQNSNPGTADFARDIEPLYERLQDIYTQIDEPDGIEGISAHLQVLNIDQQILEHRKAGRWSAAQSWYELLLSEEPDNVDVQYHLLFCLKESGQHNVLLNQVDNFPNSQVNTASLSLATEASWITEKWTKLEAYCAKAGKGLNGDFNIGIGTALLALAKDKPDVFSDSLQELKRRTARSLTMSNTTSLQGCHDILLKLHVLSELGSVGLLQCDDSTDQNNPKALFSQRLELLGAFVSEKQYLLGLRRACMHLTNAKLARKAGFLHQAFNAVLRASQLGEESAKIEHSRLLWKEGHHRKAIQSLEGAIAANAFKSLEEFQAEESMTVTNPGQRQHLNISKARAHLLLARWNDGAGQTQSNTIIDQYREAIRSHQRWEKGHYYLGKHYNKLLESEKAKIPGKQAQTYISGETAKLVIDNYLRSLAFGAKYIYQTLPRILTLWLELGSDAGKPLDPKYGNDENFRSHTMTQRQRQLEAANAHMKRYVDRLPAFVFYTAFSQIVARIVHTNLSVFSVLLEMVAKVVGTYPQHALWTLLAVVKSSSTERTIRGRQCIDRILENARKLKESGKELKALVQHGQRLSDQLLHVCEGEIQGKPTSISLAKSLGFIHRTAPCRLVIPLEANLTASLPIAPVNVDMKRHHAFPHDVVTISSFLDDAIVLNSLQRPRKISIKGSDGHVYALLCKPKDDLRKDQRLMEFNTMINRTLKKDVESSKRRLYIKTYAVTPLNEECGLIEWVDNLKTLRDILINSYRQKNVPINYGQLRHQLDEACSSIEKLPLFTHKVLAQFPPVFHDWFVEMFPEPGAWFAARLRYTRSCAVMSVVGHVLGLGDRHGENILFEEGNGGTFHVDFNCLFDKGLTFEKPEEVPFRLTHNMVDAFGSYGYEGPFRKSAELTLQILRQHEDTLMTILETFLYDPTTDFIGKKKKQVNVKVPDTPEGVLESVRNKVRGLLPLESVPLSVEGYVHELIKQATDPWNLARMYIGWCAFF